MVTTGSYHHKARPDQRVAQAVIARRTRARATADEESPELPRSGQGINPKSCPEQRSESSERDHAALDRSEVEQLEVQRLREGFTAWRKTQSSDLTVAVETGSEEKADLKASFVQFATTSEHIRTMIRDLVGCVTTTKELGQRHDLWSRTQRRPSCRT